jgi:hypothetical protein
MAAAKRIRKNLDSTGIGACARHGCFVPHCVVHFKKGKKFEHISLTPNFLADMNVRQMNMDYSVCNALTYHSKGLRSCLFIYDIACQWFIYFFQQVALDDHLSLYKWDEFIAAVDKFHLGAHIPSCFSHFSLKFVHGAGQQDGDILETLWTDFNKVSPSARSMSKAHWTQVYDNHMHNSNWKKLVGIGKPFVHSLFF